MIDKIEQLLRMHGYAKSDANEEIFYVKIVGGDSKGIFIIQTDYIEKAYGFIKEGKQILGQDAGILVLVFSHTGEVSWIENEGRFEEMRQPIAMVINSVMERGKSSGERTRYIPKVTIFLIIANVIFFIVTQMKGDAIYRWGASSWQWIINQHQWYRLLTSNYLHFGFEHLFNNMVVLLVLGYKTEEILGSIKYMMLYTGAGLVGSVASVGFYMMTNQDVMSAGASGAIFGLVGALFMILIKDRGKTPGFYGRGFLIIILGSLYHGVSSAGIDNAAHIGGFLGGVLMTFILYRSSRER